MSDKSKFKQRVFPVIFMLIITVVFISVLSVIYSITKDTIALQESLFLKKAILYASGIKIPEDEKEIVKIYDIRIREKKDEDGKILYYEILNEDQQEIKGYVIKTEGPGLWGKIVTVIGIEKDKKTLIGIEFTEQSETPGLGARISETWFKEQFRGKSGAFSTVQEGNPSGEHEFQAITGATLTTNYVKAILNDTIDELEKGLIK